MSLQEMLLEVFPRVVVSCLTELLWLAPAQAGPNARRYSLDLQTCALASVSLNSHLKKASGWGALTSAYHMAATERVFRPPCRSPPPFCHALPDQDGQQNHKQHQPNPDDYLEAGNERGGIPINGGLRWGAGVAG